MNTITKNYTFGDTSLKLSHQHTEHTVRLIQQEYHSNYHKLLSIDFEDNDVVLDIGANLGILSILLAKKFPNIKIYAFEASTINYHHLVENLHNNDITNVIPFNNAVWGVSGDVIEIPTSPTNSGGSSIYYKDEFKSKYPINVVETISLLDILTRNKIDTVKLLKIDIEGAEYEVFKSFGRENFNLIENLSIEYHRCSGKSVYHDLESDIQNSTMNLVCKFHASGNKLT